jgi:antitoxin (DNA-binding transcriptional repressor) of toxin-antitoxin stability system
MEQIAVSKFKATCLSVLEQVRKTRKPVLVTRFGVPLAQVTPPPQPKRRSSWIGCMEGTVEILGDIVGPISSEQDWEAGRD